MIRGVSRFSVEIKKTGNPYFERAICFVRPEYAREERVDLHRAAQEMMEQFCCQLESDGEEKSQPPAKLPFSLRLRAALPLIISGLTGAAAAFLICLLV